jgi:hypothetical protein
MEKSKMNITKVERKELALLSKDVFGSSTRWEKLIYKGYDELVTEEKEETIPPEKEGDESTTRKVKVPVLLNGSKHYVRKYHTVESVLEYMVEQKKQLDTLRAQINQQRQELIAKIDAESAAKKAKEEADKLTQQVNAAIAGSANV